MFVDKLQKKVDDEKQFSFAQEKIILIFKLIIIKTDWAFLPCLVLKIEMPKNVEYIQKKSMYHFT